MPREPKSSVAGAGFPFGASLPKNTPMSELVGALTFEMPFSAPVVWRLNPVPSGVGDVQPGQYPTGPAPGLMLTVNCRISPALKLPANTGDCAGAESPELAVLPFGIPASQGSLVPGTNISAVAAKGRLANTAKKAEPISGLRFILSSSSQQY